MRSFVGILIAFHRQLKPCTFDVIVAMNMFMIMMVVVVLMRASLLELPCLFAPPGAPQHTQGDENNDGGAGKLEVGFGSVSVEILPQIHAKHGH